MMLVVCDNDECTEHEEVRMSHHPDDGTAVWVTPGTIVWLEYYQDDIWYNFCSEQCRGEYISKQIGE